MPPRRPARRRTAPTPPRRPAPTAQPQPHRAATVRERVARASTQKPHGRAIACGRDRTRSDAVPHFARCGVDERQNAQPADEPPGRRPAPTPPRRPAPTAQPQPHRAATVRERVARASTQKPHGRAIACGRDRTRSDAVPHFARCGVDERQNAQPADEPPGRRPAPTPPHRPAPTSQPQPYRAATVRERVARASTQKPRGRMIACGRDRTRCGTSRGAAWTNAKTPSPPSTSPDAAQPRPPRPNRTEPRP